jgi:hypothetical protein
MTDVEYKLSDEQYIDGGNDSDDDFYGGLVEGGYESFLGGLNLSDDEESEEVLESPVVTSDDIKVEYDSPMTEGDKVNSDDTPSDSISGGSGKKHKKESKKEVIENEDDKPLIDDTDVDMVNDNLEQSDNENVDDSPMIEDDKEDDSPMIEDEDNETEEPLILEEDDSPMIEDKEDDDTPMIEEDTEEPLILEDKEEPLILEDKEDDDSPMIEDETEESLKPREDNLSDYINTKSLPNIKTETPLLYRIDELKNDNENNLSKLSTIIESHSDKDIIIKIPEVTDKITKWLNENGFESYSSDEYIKVNLSGDNAKKLIADNPEVYNSSENVEESNSKSAKADNHISVKKHKHKKTGGGHNRSFGAALQNYLG